ncbi:MAG: response regulator [Acidobacteria bacterium]|nr:response regulator [Acidobacteriota bacterium]
MNPSILIVEDADTCRDTLEIALSSINGFTVLSCATAEDALQELEHNPAVAVITDINLPGMNGYDLIRHILRRCSPRPAILVISGDTDPATPQRVLTLGADAFFPKPYSPAEVRRTLENLIHAF